MSVFPWCVQSDVPTIEIDVCTRYTFVSTLDFTALHFVVTIYITVQPGFNLLGQDVNYFQLSLNIYNTAVLLHGNHADTHFYYCVSSWLDNLLHVRPN